MLSAGTPDAMKRVTVQSVLVTPYDLKKGGNVTIAANFTLSKSLLLGGRGVGGGGGGRGVGGRRGGGEGPGGWGMHKLVT